MKKVLYLILAVLMILPMAISCGNAPKGTPVEVANVKIYSFKEAYDQAETGAAVNPSADEATPLYTGVVTAYVEEGAQLTLGDVVEGYVQDIDGDAVLDDNGRYTKLAGLSEGDGFFWFFKVNGDEVSLNTPIQATDAIEIVYGK